MQAEVVEITPDIAEEWLKKNTHNRNVKRELVQKYADAIRRGEWRMTGEAIKFNSSRLLDGQNRLLAVIEAGRPITSLVVHGLDESAQEAMDTGARRTLADVFQLRGETRARALASLVVMIWKYENHLETASGARGYPTIHQALSVLESHPGLRDHVKNPRALSRLGITEQLASFLSYQTARIDPEDSAFFFDRLASGEGLEAGSPILALRNSLERDRASRRPMSSVHRMAMCIKAWNAFRRGEPMTMAYWRAGGRRPEAYPRFEELDDADAE